MQLNIIGLHIKIFGNQKKKPIIFLHGFPYDHQMWENQISALKNDYLCIAYDLRGLGKSFIGDGQYPLEFFVDDLFKIITELNLEKPIVCGLSMGGYITLRALERDQSTFSAAILCNTRSASDDKAGLLKRVETIRRINEEGLSSFVIPFVTGCFSEETPKDNPKLYKSTLNRSLKSDPIGVKGCMIALATRTDTTPFLKKIKIPTLVMSGSFDRLTPPVLMREMANKIPKADFAIAPRAGHLAPLENPSFVNDLIKGFLKKNKL